MKNLRAEMARARRAWKFNIFKLGDVAVASVLLSLGADTTEGDGEIGCRLELRFNKLPTER